MTVEASLDVRKCKFFTTRDQSTGTKRYKLLYDGKEVPHLFTTKKNLELYIRNPHAYKNIVKGIPEGIKLGFPLIYADREGRKFQLRLEPEKTFYVDPEGKRYDRSRVREEFMFVRRLSKK